MKTFYSCVTGTQHKYEGKECQDIIETYGANSLFVTVLCDGAGSKRYGTECARLVAKTALDDLVKNFNNFNPNTFIETISETLDDNGYTDKNAGTTLIFLATDGDKFIVGHLGDGVVLQETDGEFRVISEPQNGHLANITYFLPSGAASKHFRVKSGKIKRPTAFILASDGVSSFLYDPKTLEGYNACKSFAEWTRMPSVAECGANFNDNLQHEFSKYTSDDMSIAVTVID